jgi:serine-type D-Ala-D-Ala carboxypeptidase (penicillin-binding protein 5/6)
MTFLHHKYFHKSICLILAACISVGSFFCDSITAHATLDELQAAAEERKSLPIQTNDIENWPNGPEISAESAILMDANTGVILYAKNIHERCYPASTTKLITCLLAMQNGNLDDMVTFSRDAVYSVPADGSNMGMDAGQAITLEECLYGILVGSANEVANAVAEHIGGTIDNFISMMNEYAASVGCKDSHFMNANGLYDDNHYTTAYDLAQMSRAFFQNEMLCKIGDTPRYHFEATATQPDDFYLNNKHKLITGEIPYDGILGGKTGYTDEARQTLVTCAEQNGMKLICVVFKEESPTQFTDTVELFDYGFKNFQTVNISEKEEKYKIEPTGFLQTGNDIFGSSKPILSIDPTSYVIIPNTASFDDLQSEIVYDDTDSDYLAQIVYTYQGTFVGNAYIQLASDITSTYDFSSEPLPTEEDTIQEEPSEQSPEGTIFINVKQVLIFVVVLAVVVILIFIVRALIRNNGAAKRRNNRVKRRKRRRDRIRSDFNDFDF